MGTTNVTTININNGKTNKNALILFFLSVFRRLTFKGNQSVVNICLPFEIVTSNKKGEKLISPLNLNQL